MKLFPYAVYPNNAGLRKSISHEEEDPNNQPIPDHNHFGKVHDRIAEHLHKRSRKRERRFQ